MRSKRIYVILFFLTFSSIQVFSQEYYFWENHTKRSLQLEQNRHYLALQKPDKALTIKSLGISTSEIEEITTQEIGGSLALVDKNVNTTIYWTQSRKSLNKNSITNSPNIVYSSPSFLINGKAIGLSQFFYVKLRKEGDYSILKSVADQYKVAIIGQQKHIESWFILSCDKNSDGNALEMANKFYESGMFEFSFPDFIDDLSVDCKNDTYFGDQ